MKSLYTYLNDILQQMYLTEFITKGIAVVLCLLGISLVAVVSFHITKLILVRIVHKFVERSKTLWDDYLLKRRVFSAAAHLVPAFIVYFTYNFSDIKILNEFLVRISLTYFIIVALRIINGSIKAGQDVYETTPYAQNRSIKGYVQLVQILVYFICSLFIIAILAGKSPMVLLAGLSAVAAVLLLVFKDTILGFVASIQLSANDMLKPGDWIEMPKHNADGIVIDISLNTVKIQNWDKTITTIPTYAMISESFNNWKGMEESDGRRIKRSINIDMKTVRFCDSEMLEKFEKFMLIRDYVVKKQKEITAFNQNKDIDNADVYNARRQTNLGVFRKYLDAYLSSHPMINTDMSMLVRYLQPTDKGIPIEIYGFSKDQQWVNYENLQADILDHVLAILPEFELKVFQNPSGNDFASLLSGK